MYSKNINDCFEKCKTTKEGLSSIEAQERLLKNGQNKIAEVKKKNKFLCFLSQVKDVMVIILLIAACISAVVAIINKKPSELVDTFVILSIVLINAILGFVQELKAEKSLEALKKMVEKECKVLRDGEVKKIASVDVVVGDIVVLEAGDIVPADIRLCEVAHLKCDESSLTGESVPVEKELVDLDEKTPLSERKNMVYSGTVITYGRGVGIVVGVGKDTEIGKIAEMLNNEKKSLTPLQENMKSLGKIVTFIVIGISALVFALELIQKPGEKVLEAFLTAVAVAVAAIPESMPAVVTIIAALGVSKLAKKKAIVKKLNAVETLGCCEVICTDKTGTLTQNKMVVQNVYYNGTVYKNKECVKNEELDMLIKTMTLCNDSSQNGKVFLGDPTETALCDFALEYNVDKTELGGEWVRVDEIPFDSIKKTMTTFNKNGDTTYSFTKGGLDEVLVHCKYIQLNGETKLLTDEIKKQIIDTNNKFAEKALRTLAFAFSKDGESENLVFVGIVGMSDPARPEVKDAVKKCLDAGMMPVMITGDHKTTAFAIAKEIGIAKKPSEVITGVELDKLSDEEFLERIHSLRVYARVTPENKVRIVKTFKKLGKVVAMTGDGVNDAPSIKSADIGIGMGITGTDVSKDVADVVLSDDNFATIIVAVEEGRKIYKNIEKTVKFLFSANMAELMTVLITTIFFPQFVFLLPVQILFVNIITDSLPAIALGLEPPERQLMLEKPRSRKQKLFSKRNLIDIFVMAGFQCLLIISAYVLGLELYGEQIATTMAFVTLNLVQCFFIFTARVEGSIFKSNPFKNKWILYSVLFSLVMVVLLVATPMNVIVHTEHLDWLGWVASLGFSLLIIPIGELYKFSKSKIVNKIEQKKVLKEEK